ncbi:MAG: hypothetical protein JRI56_12865 [Deltaproteobacteria bacterium]|nr:hypothetical protein [Deltaproteobacteria bacterium]
MEIFGRQKVYIKRSITAVALIRIFQVAYFSMVAVRCTDEKGLGDITLGVQAEIAYIKFFSQNRLW